MKTNAPSQEPTSFDDKRIDPRNNSGTGNGGGASKPSRNKKKTEPIFKSGTGTADAASKATCPNPKQQHANNGSRLPLTSESASTSTCGNSTTTSTTTTMTTGAAKSSDAKLSDSISRGSNNSNRSDSIDSVASAPIRRHTGGDCRWEAIQLVNAKESPIGIGHFVLLKRLGYGDIGSVYLVELRGIGTFFAMKVMDKASIASRNKLLRAQTEREILIMLDHPFLPTLYSHFETEKFYCLVMEYCSGGNLHSLRQKQPNKHFTEQAARFYASEVLLALEYLHMLGIVYRDLKPENVLVREEGHIMLSDFDLSLRCSVDPTLVKSSSRSSSSEVVNAGMIDGDQTVQSCIQPSSFFPRILAPEIIRGEGHGSAVDWWTFGIFLYELLHGMTPFKGSGNKATLQNVVSQPLRFPETPLASLVARDLIQGLLVKDPQRRIAYHRGATEIKQHPFFEGINWALVRSIAPPHVPC